ncbi:hypothetical protein B0H16DRAFT_570341 [Mycena metata]|uniref:Uncharacterized protein n=1 Tax=Mycena metata TaxID=1033252 RepID=A0AAD7JBF4_9AGAR|nr:hypothetical protein B0H16DRAFT_570341 [Mycena metata]
MSVLEAWEDYRASSAQLRLLSNPWPLLDLFDNVAAAAKEVALDLEKLLDRLGGSLQDRYYLEARATLSELSSSYPSLEGLYDTHNQMFATLGAAFGIYALYMKAYHYALDPENTPPPNLRNPDPEVLLQSAKKEDRTLRAEIKQADACWVEIEQRLPQELQDKPSSESSWMLDAKALFLPWRGDSRVYTLRKDVPGVARKARRNLENLLAACEAAKSGLQRRIELGDAFGDDVCSALRAAQKLSPPLTKLLSSYEMDLVFATHQPMAEEVAI